jgi:hypothetical protein
MSHVVGGGDRGGETRSKRDGRRGCDRAHRGGEEWRGGGSPVDRHRHVVEVKEEGATEHSGARSRGRMRGKEKRGRQSALYRLHGGVAVRRRDGAGSGLAAAHDRRQNRGEATLTRGGGDLNTIQIQTNSNYFKSFQTLTDPKTAFPSPKNLK